jgi:hypothetical protein
MKDVGKMLTKKVFQPSVPRTNIHNIISRPVIQKSNRINESQFLNVRIEGTNLEENERLNQIVQTMGDIWRDENFQRGLIEYLEEMKYLIDDIKQSGLNSINLYKEDVKAITEKFIEGYRDQLERILNYTKREMKNNNPETFYYHFYKNTLKSLQKIYQVISPLLRGRFYRVIDIQKTVSPVMQNSISENPLWIEESVNIVKNIMMTKMNKYMNRSSNYSGKSKNMGRMNIRLEERRVPSTTISRPVVPQLPLRPQSIPRSNPLQILPRPIPPPVQTRGMTEKIVRSLPGLLRRIPK